MNFLPHIDSFKTIPDSVFDSDNTIDIEDWCKALDYMKIIGGSFTYDGIIRIKKTFPEPNEYVLNKKLLMPEGFKCTDRIVFRNLKMIELPEDLTITGSGLFLFDTCCLSKLDINKIKFLYIEISESVPNYDLKKIDNFIMAHYGPNIEKESIGSLVTYSISL